MKIKKLNAKKNFLAVDEVFQKIALTEGTSVEQVKSEIRRAILIGWNSSDPQTREIWRQIPCKGDMPTPEELVYWGSIQMYNARLSMLRT